MIVSFDFDCTLWRIGFDPEEGIFSRNCGVDPIAIEEVKNWISKGASVHIVTSRVNSNRSEVDKFLETHGELISGVHFTNGCSKGPLLASLGAILHYDDDDVELGQLEPRTRGVLWTTGCLDENNNICDPLDSRFHFDNWS